MKKIIKNLLIIFAVVTLLKIILSYFIPSPSAFSDSYIYAKMARSFFNFGIFSVHGLPTHQYLPLYPILLSISYIFNDMTIVYSIMKVINSVLSSLIIFPTFLLAKEFLNEKKSLIVSLLVSIIPSNFAFSAFLMSENVYYTLFLFSIYFIYKSFIDKSYKYDILAGVFIALTYLTKANGLILIPVVGAVFIINLFRKKYEFKKKIVMAIVFLLISAPWFIRNGLLFGFNITGMLGGYSSEVGKLFGLTAIYPFLSWIFLYVGFLIIASGILFPILASLNI
ncbi:glycosyltransferase family 39 protein, partial [archaeon]|nr:glycosyltransferase family 39 protein [archaeon]